MGYTLPIHISRKVLMEKCRIYATAYNPFIFVKDKQLKESDPETNGSNTKVAEARFLRAVYYFNAIEQFGGVTLLIDQWTDSRDLFHVS